MNEPFNNDHQAPAQNVFPVVLLNPATPLAQGVLCTKQILFMSSKRDRSSPGQSGPPVKMVNTMHSPKKNASASSTPTEARTNEDIYKAIERMNQNLEAKITQSEGRTAEKLAVIEEQLMRRITDLEVKTEELLRENRDVKEQNRNLTARINQIERDIRKNNIVVTGAKVSNVKEAKEEMDRISQEYARDYPKLSNIRFIPAKPHVKIIGTCESMDHKIHIMRQKKEMKGKNGEMIYVDNDLAREDSRIQYLARQEAKRLRKEDKKVIIRDDKIIIDGEWWQFDPESEKFTKKQDFRQRP